MIYTCTLNPAVDYRLEVDDFKTGKLNRSKYSRFTVGGKGINVSLVLKQLGYKSIAMGFMGGFTGEYIRDYLQKDLNIQSHFLTVNTPTRINVKLLTNNVETEINQAGPIIDVGNLDQLIDYMKTFDQKDVLIIGGSQGRSKLNSYAYLAQAAHDLKIEFVVDTSGKTILDVLKYRPLLVKPNIHELEEYFDVSIETEKSIILYAKKLIELGAKSVIVSCGGNGSYFVTDQVVYTTSVIPGKVKNTVGAGDSMVAGFVGEWTTSKDLRHAYKTAIACATATAYSQVLAKKKDIDTYLEKIEIKEVSQ